MGWKLNSGLALGALALIVIFKDKLAGLVTGAGQAVGESIGGGIGGLVSGIPTGIVSGAATEANKIMTPGVGFETSCKTPFCIFDSWLPSPTNQGQESAKPPSSQGQQKQDQVVTQNNRDFSDSPFIKTASGNVATFTNVLAGVTALAPGVGHADRVNFVKSLGFESPRQIFGDVRAQALAHGLSPSQAFRLASKTLR